MLDREMDKGMKPGRHAPKKGLEPEKSAENAIPSRTNHLLVIGIDEYHSLGKLANARRDAEALVNVLSEKYQFEFENIEELYNEDASKKAITTTLRTLAEKATSDDNLLIYFSGHGYYDDFLKEGYWVPSDAEYEAVTDYITYTYLRQVIKATSAHHVFIIADSCYSGAVLVRKKDFKPERFERDPSRWLLASGRNEVVPDGIAGEHSPFAEGLLDLLERYSDEGIRAGTMVDKLTSNISYNSNQTPIGRALYNVGDRGGEFVFYPRLQALLGRSEKQVLAESKQNAQSSIPRKKKKGKKIGSFYIFLIGIILGFTVIIPQLSKFLIQREFDKRLNAFQEDLTFFAGFIVVAENKDCEVIPEIHSEVGLLSLWLEHSTPFDENSHKFISSIEEWVTYYHENENALNKDEKKKIEGLKALEKDVEANQIVLFENNFQPLLEYIWKNGEETYEKYEYLDGLGLYINGISQKERIETYLVETLASYYQKNEIYSEFLRKGCVDISSIDVL